MKKFTVLFFILVFLSFNIIRATTVYAATTFKEGVHSVTDFDFLSSNVYTIQNTSINNSVYVFIFDKNQVVQQTLRLKPQSSKYNLLPLEPDYKIVVIGNGEVSIS